MIDISTRVVRNSKLGAYLLQLRELVGRQVSEKELSTIADLERIQAGSAKLADREKTVLRLTLEVLHGRRFADYVRRLKDANSNAVYIWLHATSACGVCSVPSIVDVNFKFDHLKIPEGVIVFLTADYKDRLLLDFDTEAVEVEAQGDSWSSVKF